MSRDDLMQPWHGFCIAAGREASNDERYRSNLRRNAGGSVGVWTFWGKPQSTTPARTEVVSILADDPKLKLASETSPYMRTER